MRIKQNLPLLLGLATAGAVGALVVALQPTDAERLRRAVADHVRTLDGATDFSLHGAVAEVRGASGPPRLLAFAKHDGAWRFDRDLFLDFDAWLADPANARAVAERLAQRLHERTRREVGVTEGLQSQFHLALEDGAPVVRLTVAFAYPAGPDGASGPRGRYAESFRWEAGAWVRRGGGSLFDPVPAPRPK